MKQKFVKQKVNSTKKKQSHFAVNPKEAVAFFLCSMMLTVFCVIICPVPVYAAAGGTLVTNAFNVIYEIIAAVVSSIGTIMLLWGLFEWAQSMNTQDGGAQSMAFKRIGGGLIATIGPQLIPLINTAIGTPQ